MAGSTTPTVQAPAAFPFERVAQVGFALAVLAGLVLIGSGFGYRFGWWGLRTAFTMLKWSAYGGGLAALVSVAGFVLGWLGRAPGGVWLPLAGLAVGLVVLRVPWGWLARARAVPAIHDITTDTTNPPAFVAVLPLRANAPNKPEYGGPAVAAQQLKAYPDVKPAVLTVPPAQAFAQALAAARDMGWEIVAADSAAGRIEATATTFWYGFKDDVVIRVTPSDRGSRIDVRSESRLGGSDVGTNARRITTYLKKLAGT
jgi:uncharacterized protein (DUF1499 family)